MRRRETPAKEGKMIKILIDSASDLEQEEARRMGISMIPMEIGFGEETFSDGVNLSHRQFFEKLAASDVFPKTSQINEFRWGEAFGKLTQNGDQVIAITISSKLSGTFACAQSAAARYPGQVFAVDSLNAAAGERILGEYALRLLREGRDAETIVCELQEKRGKIQVIAVVDTLKYLRKGGRISGAAALAGEMLSVKPVVSVTDGEVKLAGKAIGSKRSNNLLMQLVKRCGGINFSMPYGLMYSGLSDEYLKRYLRDSEALWKGHIDDPDRIPVYLIGSTIGAHIGPNAVGVAFFSN